MKPLKLLTVYALQFSPDGQALVTVSKDVVVWDVAQRCKRYRVHPVSHPSHVCFSPSGDRVAVKSTNGTLQMLDAVSGQVQHVLDRGSDGEGSNIRFSRCGEYLVDGSWNGALSVRSASSGRVEFRKVFTDEMITTVAHSADGLNWFRLHQPLVSESSSVQADPYISLWAWPFTESHQRIRLSQPAWVFATSPDGSMLATITGIGARSLSVIRVQDHAILRTATIAWTRAISWSPTGRELGATTETGITIYSIPDLTPVAETTLKFASDVKWSPNGELVALGDWKCGFLMDRASMPRP